MLYECDPFTDPEGMEGAGLVHKQLGGDMLAGHLALLVTTGVANVNPMFPNKQCRFSAAQLEKVYRAEGVAARVLSSFTMLQVYQTELLEDMVTALATGEPMQSSG